MPDDFLSFENFHLDTIRKTAKPLLASKGNEFDIDFSAMNPKERLALQKKQIREQLGFGSEFMDGKF
jgi:TATA-binding protein-associated factor